MDNAQGRTPPAEPLIQEFQWREFDTRCPGCRVPRDFRSGTLSAVQTGEIQARSRQKSAWQRLQELVNRPNPASDRHLAATPCLEAGNNLGMAVTAGGGGVVDVDALDSAAGCNQNFDPATPLQSTPKRTGFVFRRATGSESRHLVRRSVRSDPSAAPVRGKAEAPVAWCDQPANPNPAFTLPCFRMAHSEFFRLLRKGG